MTNPLAPVMDWYQSALDCFNVAQRVDRLRVPKVVTAKHPVLYRIAEGDRERVIEDAKEALERLTVVDLVAVFERTVRVHLAGVVARVLPADPPYGDTLRSRFESDLEMWRFKDQLVDAFGSVDAGTRRLVKDVYDFRNWAAHGWHTPKPAPQRFRPRDAHDYLTAFLKAVGIVS